MLKNDLTKPEKRLAVICAIIGIAFGITFIVLFFQYFNGVDKITDDAISECIGQADLVSEKTATELENLVRLEKSLQRKILKIYHSINK